MALLGFGQKKAKDSNDRWAGWPETLDVSDSDDVNWIKQSNDPLVWHTAAIACLIFRGDEHGLMAWLARQPSLDRVTAAAMFMHGSNGVRYLTKGNIEAVRMKPIQVQEMIDLLCDLSETHALTDNGIGMASGWEAERAKTIAALVDNPRAPMRILERPIDQQTAAMPYTDIGEGELVSEKFIRENMPFLRD
jgi:hypothetical protein